MTMQKVASGFVIFQLIFGQVMFAHAGEPGPAPQVALDACSQYYNTDKDKLAEYYNCICNHGTNKWDGYTVVVNGQTITRWCKAGQPTIAEPDNKTQAQAPCTGPGCNTSRANPPAPPQIPPSTVQRGEAVASPPPSATTGATTTYVATQPARPVVYQTGPAPASDSSVSIDSKWLWGLGGLALGVGAGYLIWGNQYKTQYVPYNQPQQPPYWQGFGSNAWGQVPGRYSPYGPGMFGQNMGGPGGYGGYPVMGGYRPYMGVGGGYMGGQSPISYPAGGSMGGIGGIGGGGGYGLGGNYQLRQPPVMLPPVY